MNGFEKHNLTHTSPSQINMYANAPCAWAAKYIFGGKFTFGHAARAGVLVEEAVVNVIAKDMDLDDACDFALKAFSKHVALGGSEADIKRGNGIPDMIKLSVDALKEYGKPEYDGGVINGLQQKKVEMICNGDGWKLPVMGYLDFYYPQHKLVIDLKTTMRMPSNMSIEHYRQGAIYKAATGFDVKFLYVTPKKSKFIDIEDIDETLADIKALLNRQEKMLQKDAEDIRQIMPINSGSYYWSDDEALKKQVYGL